LDEALHPYSRETSPADDVVDELMPPELEWQDLVRRYPMAALTLAAIGGYVLGSHRGREIIESFANFAADTVSEQVNHLLGKDVI
jgi:hypothetical protein